jgi:heme/copper-type cytochrome/quinol oxidase subunit 1
MEKQNAGFLNTGSRYKGLLGWIFSTDHKRIGILYLVSILTFFAVGICIGLLMRLELIAPGPTIVNPDTYNAFFTLHGVIMIFLFIIPGIPAVYIMILPAMGVVSEIIPTFSRQKIYGYKAIAFSSLTIAFVGCLVWGHHMYTSGMSDTARWIFSLLTFLVAIPSGVKVFNWVATLYKGSIKMKPPVVEGGPYGPYKSDGGAQ